VRTDGGALILSDLGETLVQNGLATALFGDRSHYTGLARSEIYRWFTDPAEPLRYPDDDRDRQSRAQGGEPARRVRLDGGAVARR